MPRPAPAVEETPTILTLHDFTPDPDLDGITCQCQLPRPNRHHHDAFMGPAPRFPHTPSKSPTPRGGIEDQAPAIETPTPPPAPWQGAPLDLTPSPW